MPKFEDLDVWQKSTRLSVDLYRHFATQKDFGFRDQITRSGLSIPSNIAEGYERNSDKEMVRFLTYSKGSAGELRTQIYIGIKIGYIDQAKGDYWISEAEVISRMLFALIRSIRAKNEQ